MSLERVIKALVGLGLSRVEAEIYVLLAKKGPLTVDTLEKFLNYNKHNLYSNLKNLTNNKLVSSERKEYVALPFEEVIEKLIEQEKEKANILQENRESLIASWKNNS